MLEQGQSLGPVAITRDDAGVVHITPAGIHRRGTQRAHSGRARRCRRRGRRRCPGAGTAPTSLLTEPYWAQSWVAGVYGQDVATAFERFEEPDFSGPARSTPSPGS